MAEQPLHDDEWELLREAVTSHRPDLLPLLARLGKAPLTLEQRESLREAVSDEFAATGLGPDYEPNPRGLKLESLIDRLGHL